MRLRFGEQQLAVDERLKVSTSGCIATLLAFKAVGQSADEGLQLLGGNGSLANGGHGFVLCGAATEPECERQDAN